MRAQAVREHPTPVERRYILHADDLGLSRGMTESIFAAHDHGVLNSASIVPNGVAFDRAVDGARRRRSLRLGVHLNLMEGRPLAAPDRVPLLVDREGEFRSSFPDLWRRLAFGVERQALREQVKHELREQLVRVQSSFGTTFPLRIDSHQYYHLIPPVLDVLLELHDEFRFEYLRVVNEPFFLHIDELRSVDSYVGPNLAKHLLLKSLSARARLQLAGTTIEMPDAFIGVLFSGRMSAEVVTAALKQIDLRTSPTSVIEVLFHPGGARVEEEVLWKRRKDLVEFYRSPRRHREAEALRSASLRRTLKLAPADFPSGAAAFSGESPANDPAWARVVTSTYGLERAEVTSPGFRAEFFRHSTPLRNGPWATAPFLSHGGVTFEPGFDRTLTLRSLQDFLSRSGSPSLVLRSHQTFFDDGPSTFTDREVGTFVLDLREGAERIWSSRLDARTRNQVRKGQRQPLKLRVGGDELLDDFHEVISIAWRDLGTPSHSKVFFRRILREFGDRAELMVLSLGSRPVSAAMLFSVNGTLHHSYAATLKACNALCVNNVLYWNIIQYGCERGLTWFDLGRSRSTQSTAPFKASWGAEPVPLPYTFVFQPGHAPSADPSSLIRTATDVWRRLPLSLTRNLGPWLIRTEL